MIACRTTVLILLITISASLYAQTAHNADFEISSNDPLSPVSGTSISKVQQKLNSLEQAFDRKTATYLKKLQKQETRIYKKLWKKDSVAAKELMGNIQERYGKLQAESYRQTQQLSRLSQVYNGKLDSLSSAFGFLENSRLVFPEMKQQLAAATQSVRGLQQQLNQTDWIRKQLKERKNLLAAQLEKYGLKNELKGFNKQFYYYQQQLNEYKVLLNDPEALGKKLLGTLAELPAFRNYFAKSSLLASLFNLPGSTGNDPALLAGLQTRASVMQNLQNRFGTGPMVQQALQQQVQTAQAQLNDLKNKVNQYLPQGGGSDEELPDLPTGQAGFKPNRQKTKSFWQRLEYSANFQSQGSNNYFPVTSNLGLSLGYKLNDKSVLGIGTSYLIGWGQDIRHIRITHQGLGLRSFADIKLKGSFWISGGYEMNYRNEFNRIEVLRDLNAWQQSGLIGMSKVVSLNNRFFKKTRVQLLWDFLSYQQAPQTQALVFRVGYNIK